MLGRAPITKIIALLFLLCHNTFLSITSDDWNPKSKCQLPFLQEKSTTLFTLVNVEGLDMRIPARLSGRIDHDYWSSVESS
ncbi:hypothetical protein BC826DRAFT_1027302 [Russula brevipes]|nr:hypothetical protein BC826DRAFT_1027302 [Russula brevipes]